MTHLCSPSTRSLAAIVCTIAFSSIGCSNRSTLESSQSTLVVRPNAIPMKDIAIPAGGAAVIFGPQYCCNLVIVAPHGSVSYEIGSVEASKSIDGVPQWVRWKRLSGTLATHATISPDEARQFITTANAIPMTHQHPIRWLGGVHATFDQGTVYGTVRDGVAYYAPYTGAEDPVLSAIGMEPERAYGETPPLSSLVPPDAIGFVFNTSFFIVHRSGAVTLRFGGTPGDSGPISATYDVQPISSLQAWRIVTLAPLVYVPPGCPGVDNAAPYLVIVTRHHVSSNLFCHSWSPLREDLMSIVNRV